MRLLSLPICSWSAARAFVLGLRIWAPALPAATAGGLSKGGPCDGQNQHDSNDSNYHILLHGVFLLNKVAYRI